MRRTKFPVSSARRGYFQIEAGLVLFVLSLSSLFYATRRKFESPARLVAPPLLCRRSFLVKAEAFEAQSRSAGVFGATTQLSLVLPSGV